MEIVKEPNEILKTICEEININSEEFDKYIEVCNNMIPLMIDNKGCGLASTQVGINKKFFIMKLDNEIEFIFNPKILKNGKEIVKQIQEGCLSLDSKHEVDRYAVIDVEYVDKNKKSVKKTLKRWQARIFQHEYDHINGKLIKD